MEMDMELETQKQQTQLWEEGKQAEEVEEEETALLRRQSRSSLANGRNGHIEEENKENVAANCSQKKNSVYFDNNQGIWKCRHCIWTHQYHIGIGNVQNLRGNGSADGVSGTKYNDFKSSVLKTNSRDKELHIEGNNIDIQRILSTEINYHHQKDLRGEIFSCSIRSPVKISSGEKIPSLEHLDKKTEVDTDVDILNETDQDSIVFDVERVLKNQNTHDLYCPNCHSCITRRVILHRRQRKPRNIFRKSRNDKFETHSTAAVTTDQGEDTFNNCSNDSPTTAADDKNHDRQQDVFRCLSCFSLFIPTGNGFKLFRPFGDSSKNEEVQHVQNIIMSKTNWFFSVFAPDKRKPTADQGNRQPENSEVDVINQNTSSGCSENTLPCHGSDLLVAALGDTNPAKYKASSEDPFKSQQGGLESLCSTAESVLLEKQPVLVDKETNIATGKKAIADHNGLEKSIEGNRQPENSEVDGINLNTLPRCSENMLHFHGSDLPVAPVLDTNPAKTQACSEDPIKSQQGGLESLNSMSESVLLGKPPMPINQETNMVTGKKAIADHNGLDKSIQGASLQTESFCSIGMVNCAATELLETRDRAVTSSAKEPILISGVPCDVGEKSDNAMVKTSTGDDVEVIIETEPAEVESSQGAQNVGVNAGILPQTEIHVGETTGTEASEAHQWDILKSIVYGGLVESITSLGVVTSAAAAGAATLDILAMGLANLMGGLVIVAHNLRELKNDHAGVHSTHMNKPEDHYQQLLGRRENFLLHAMVVVLSFLIFGMMPPVIYGFSFCKSDNRELKIAAVAGSSLACIILLSVVKVHIQKPPKFYAKTILYYVSIGLMTLGLSFAVGDLLKKLLVKLNSFESNLDLTVPFLDTNVVK